MRTKTNNLLALALLACSLAAPAVAQDRAANAPAATPAAAPGGATDTASPAEQVIVPQVTRRDIWVPKYPSNDFAFSLLAGTYATQNFGSSAVAGVRLGYHVTEDVFFEGSYGQTKVSDEAFRQILPGGIFPQPKQTLSYYDVVAGYNLLPGEVFFGRGVARATQGYLVAGVGSTRFAGDARQTMVVGFGLRLILADHFAVQADVRDHLFSLDLLGRRQSTQNPEVVLGLTAYF